MRRWPWNLGIAPCVALLAITTHVTTAAADEIEGDFSETAAEPAKTPADSNAADDSPVDPAPASDEAAVETGDLGKWLPSLTLGFDVHRQAFDVDGTSDLGFSTSVSKTVLTSLFDVEGALFTPPLVEGFGSPRLFGQASAQIPLSDEFTILRTVKSYGQDFSQPGPPIPPTLAECPGRAQNPQYVGCDQSIESEMTLNWSWSAGLGAEFTLPFLDRDFKIRTSVNYFGQSLDFTGAAKRDDRSASGVIMDTLRIDGASASKTLHALGPELGLSGEVGRAGPLSLNVFAEARLYWLLNGGVIRYGATSADGTANFAADPQSLVAQGGAGLRITWEGYDHEQQQASVGGSHASPSDPWRAAPGRTTTWTVEPSPQRTVAVAANSKSPSAQPGALRPLGLPGSDSAPKAAPQRVAQAPASSVLSADLAAVSAEPPQDDTSESATADTEDESAIDDSDDESSEQKIAKSDETISEAEVFDSVLLRPLYFARLVVGCVVAAPVALFSLPGGIDNVEYMMDVFVGQPYRDTFTEPVGKF